MSVGEIAEAIDSSIQNTSQHLSVMRRKNLLRNRRDGQTIYYSIADEDRFPCRSLLEVEHLVVRTG
jgi:DNA-binding transcriptional ArsR family regulator